MPPCVNAHPFRASHVRSAHGSASPSYSSGWSNTSSARVGPLAFSVVRNPQWVLRHAEERSMKVASGRRPLGSKTLFTIVGGMVLINPALLQKAAAQEQDAQGE